MDYTNVLLGTWLLHFVSVVQGPRTGNPSVDSWVEFKQGDTEVAQDDLGGIVVVYKGKAQATHDTGGNDVTDIRVELSVARLPYPDIRGIGIAMTMYNQPYACAFSGRVLDTELDPSKAASYSHIGGQYVDVDGNTGEFTLKRAHRRPHTGR